MMFVTLMLLALFSIKAILDLPGNLRQSPSTNPLVAFILSLKAECHDMSL